MDLEYFESGLVKNIFKLIKFYVNEYYSVLFINVLNVVLENSLFIEIEYFGVKIFILKLVDFLEDYSWLVKEIEKYV